MSETLEKLVNSEENPKISGSAGYHGGMVSEIPEIQLQKCADFKVDFDPNLYKLSDIKNDPATQLTDLRQSLGVGAYYLDNMYSCQCGLENARSIQTSQPAISFDAGKGWVGENGCLVNVDSELRFHDATQLKYINQLPQRQNAGFFGRGDFNVDTESIIQSSEITSVDRPCNVLSGVSIDNLQPALFPMNNRLKSEVQNNIHIIPEDSMNSWVRGGLPSRQIARNVDYINRCEQLKNNGIDK